MFIQSVDRQPPPTNHSSSSSHSHARSVLRHNTEIMSEHGSESTTPPIGHVSMQSRGQPQRVSTEATKFPMNVSTNRGTTPAAFYQPFAGDLQQVQPSRTSYPPGPPVMTPQHRTQSLPVYASAPGISHETTQHPHHHVEQRPQSATTRYPPVPLPARHDGVPHYSYPLPYPPLQPPRPIHPVPQTQHPSPHIVGPLHPVAVSPPASHQGYVHPKAVAQTPTTSPLLSSPRHSSRTHHGFSSPVHEQLHPESHTHFRSHQYHVSQVHPQLFIHSPSQPHYAHTHPHTARGQLSPSQPFSSVPLPPTGATHGSPLAPPGSTPPLPQSHPPLPPAPPSSRRSSEVFHNPPLLPASSNPRSQGYPTPSNSIAPQPPAQPQVTLAQPSAQHDHVHSQPQLLPQSQPSPAQDHAESQPTAQAAETSPPPVHGPVPAFLNTPYPKGQPPQSVVSFAALALTPVQTMYEQAWSMTVGNVQQEMHRLHHGFTMLVDTERLRHQRTLNILTEERKLKEKYEEELDLLRKENGELKKEAGRENERKRPRLIGPGATEDQSEGVKERQLGLRGFEGNAAYRIPNEEGGKVRQLEMQISALLRDREEQAATRQSLEKKLTEAMGKLRAITDSVLSPLSSHHPTDLPSFGTRAEPSIQQVPTSTVHGLLHPASNSTGAVRFPLSPPLHKPGSITAPEAASRAVVPSTLQPSFATRITSSPSPIAEPIHIKAEDTDHDTLSNPVVVNDGFRKSLSVHNAQFARHEQPGQRIPRSSPQLPLQSDVSQAQPRFADTNSASDAAFSAHSHHPNRQLQQALPSQWASHHAFPPRDFPRNDHPTPPTPPSPSPPLKSNSMPGAHHSSHQFHAQSHSNKETSQTREARVPSTNVNVNQPSIMATLPVSAQLSATVRDRDERPTSDYSLSTKQVTSTSPQAALSKLGPTVLNWPPPIITDGGGTMRPVMNASKDAHGHGDDPLPKPEGTIVLNSSSKAEQAPSAASIQSQKESSEALMAHLPIQGQNHTRVQSNVESRTQTPVQAQLQTQSQSQSLMKASDQPQPRNQGPQQLTPRTRHVNSPSPVPRAHTSNATAAAPSALRSSSPSTPPAQRNSSSPIIRHTTPRSASPVKLGLGSLPGSGPLNATSVQHTRAPSSPPNPVVSISSRAGASKSNTSDNGNAIGSKTDPAAGGAIAVGQKPNPELPVLSPRIEGVIMKGSHPGSSNPRSSLSSGPVSNGTSSSARSALAVSIPASKDRETLDHHTSAPKPGLIVLSAPTSRSSSSSSSSQVTSGSSPRLDLALSKPKATSGNVPTSSSSSIALPSNLTSGSSSAPLESSKVPTIASLTTEKSGDRTSRTINTTSNPTPVVNPISASASSTPKHPLPSPPYNASSTASDAPMPGPRAPSPNQNHAVLHITTNGNIPSSSSSTSTPTSHTQSHLPQAPSAQSYYRRDAQPPTGPRDRRGYAFPLSASSSPAASALQARRTAENLQSVEGQQLHMSKFRLDEVPTTNGSRSKSPDASGTGRKRSRGEYEQDRERDSHDPKSRTGRTSPPRENSIASATTSGYSQGQSAQSQPHLPKRMRSDSTSTSNPTSGRENHRPGSMNSDTTTGGDGDNRGKSDRNYQPNQRRDENSTKRGSDSSQNLEEGEVVPDDNRKSQSLPEEGELKTPSPKDRLTDPRTSPSSAFTSQGIRKVPPSSTSTGPASSNSTSFNSHPSQPQPPTAPKSKIGINHMDILYDTKGEKMICRMCMQFINRDLESRSGPASFSVKATWPQLIGHCQNEHPDAWTALEKLSPSQVAELRQRITSGNVPRFPTSHK